MDDLTHVLAGTLMGRANPSRRRGLVLACVFGSLIPDIDVVPSLWDKTAYITLHRGFTHSLLGLGPMSLLAAWAAWGLVRRKKDGAGFKALWAMALLGVVVHILLDWCTSWGTMILWPDRTRFALDHLFIIDLWYMGLLALPILWSLFRPGQRARICAAGIGAALAYHGLAAYNHHQAMEIARDDRPAAAAEAFPQPFSPFRWSVYDREDGLLRNTRVDFLADAGPRQWQEWKEPARDADLQAAMDSPAGRQFLWFARVPLWDEEKQADGSTAVYFWDARFNAYWHEKRTTRRFGMRVVVKDGRVVEGGSWRE